MCGAGIITHRCPARKKAKKVDWLAAKVDTLAPEFAEIKNLLLNLQPGRRAPTRVDSQARSLQGWDYDALSTRASCNQLCEDRPRQGEIAASNHASNHCSHQTGSRSRAGSEAAHATIKPVVRMVLAPLGLDEAPTAGTLS